MIKNENITNALKNNKVNIKIKNNKNNFHISINNNTNSINKRNSLGNIMILGKSLNNNSQDNKFIEKKRNSLLKEKNRLNTLFSSPINKKNKITKINTEIKSNNSKIKNDGEMDLNYKDKNKNKNKNKILSIERSNSINNNDKLLQKTKNINLSSNPFINKNIKANKNIIQSNNNTNNNIINKKNPDSNSSKYFVYKDEILNNEIDKNKKCIEETRNIKHIEKRINNIYKNYDKDDNDLNNYHKDFKDEIIPLNNKSSCDKTKYDENIIIDSKEEDISDYINVNSIYYQNILYNCVNEIGNEAIEEVDEGKEDSEMTSLSTENIRKSKNKNLFTNNKIEQNSILKDNNEKEIINKIENKILNENIDKKPSNIKKISSYSRFINTKSANITKENMSFQNIQNEIKLNENEKMKKLKKKIRSEKINHSQNMKKNNTINIFLEDTKNEFIISPKKMVILSKIKNNDNKCSKKTQKLKNFSKKNSKDFNIKKYIRCITLNNFNNCNNTKIKDKNKLCLSLITDKNNSKSTKNNNINNRIINFKQNIIINYFNYSEDSDETFGNNNISEITLKSSKFPKTFHINQKDSYYMSDSMKNSQIKENDFYNNEDNIKNINGKKKSFKYYLLNSSGNITPNEFKNI